MSHAPNSLAARDIAYTLHPYTNLSAHEIRGRTLGIIGYGNIGTQLSVLAESLGISVVFYDTADRFAEVYETIAEELIGAATDGDLVKLPELTVEGQATAPLSSPKFSSPVREPVTTG